MARYPTDRQVAAQIRDEFAERLRRLGVFIPQATVMLSGFASEPLASLTTALVSREKDHVLANRVLVALWGSPPMIPNRWWGTALGVCLGRHLLESLDGQLSVQEAAEMLGIEPNRLREEVRHVRGDTVPAVSAMRWHVNRSTEPLVEWNYGALPVAERPATDLEELSRQILAERGPQLPRGFRHCKDCGGLFHPVNDNHHRCDPCHEAHWAAIRSGAAPGEATS